MENKVTYKLRKRGKHWVTLTALAVGVIGAGAVSTSASADEITAPQTEQLQESSTVQEPVVPIESEKGSENNAPIQEEQVNQVEIPVQNDVPVQEETSNTEVGNTATENTTVGNEGIDNAIKDAENEGVEVVKDPEQTKDTEEEVQKDVTEQEKELNDTTEAQKEINDDLENAVNDAEDNGVSVDKEKEQIYKDKEKAKADAQKQIDALNEATKVMNEANKKIEDAIAKAKANGTPIKEGSVITASVKDAMKKAQEIIDRIQAIDIENAEIKQRNREALDAYNKAKAELDAKNAKIKAENEAIAKRNKEKQDAYEKALEEFNNGVNSQITITANAQGTDPNVPAPSGMKVTVDQKTGEFTLTHDMNDSYHIIGHGVLKGKLITKITSLGNGKEKITIVSVELYSYTYTNTGFKNQLDNKNINFHVYVDGKEIYSRVHDGDNTFSDKINKTFGINKTYIVNPGESTPGFEFLRVDDNWVWNTHGQIWTKLKNTNVAPKKPTLEQEKPLDPTQLTPPTPEELKEAVADSIQVEASYHPVKLQANVHPVKLAEKPATPVTMQATPTANTPVHQASVLPVTGEKEEMLGALGIAMLTSLGLVVINKKRKVN